MTESLALLETLDRDGQVRHQFKVNHWPIRVGRAIDNDFILDDPHLAACHLTLTLDAAGLHVLAGETLNGLVVAGQGLEAGQSALLTEPVAILHAGSTTLRLRRPGEALAPEVRIEARPVALRGRPVLWASLMASGFLLALFEWLTSNPDEWVFNFGQSLLIYAGVLVAWSGIWALVSKVITRRSHFGWHVRVALWLSVGCAVAAAVPGCLAFVLSWPALSSFAFAGPYWVMAVAMTYHLRKATVRHGASRYKVAGLLFGLTLGLHLGVNQTLNSRWGDSLYLTHLYPARMRLAPAQNLEQFMQGATALQRAVDDSLAKGP